LRAVMRISELTGPDVLSRQMSSAMLLSLFNGEGTMREQCTYNKDKSGKEVRRKEGWMDTSRSS
jgi:hypothetical protein